ncbi:hypothetical protein ZIOFF_070657 [Zingiber officinale]|uniref:Uncharacterized protein n=1 Tax=Zingiber officinale TaxID=94328 RepID=A0A8J5EB03_ZINOF|nr:hypothetical protein ZIOFF_070657 [Zingiber officinale]
MQDDLLYLMLTVEETLMFSVEFRLSCSVSAIKKISKVQVLINQLGLHAITGTLIGDEIHHGISSGEQCRVSINIDIIHDTILLFLDEPTSCLDSTNGSTLSPTPPPVINPPPASFPVDNLKVWARVGLFSRRVNVEDGDPAANQYCQMPQGIVDLEAAVYLCTAIKLKLLNVYLALQLPLT